ncbi:MAG: hypothetical protein KME60_13490 [Cyanomargarita calcarea GSE-NOS-MK-12-04C]|jgi:hypothetical protein|uniref:Uncharacterized protein n=1 Tax=Cyanomargarita calcarea GSE-NOS-MK-12-04C TaxID=2839659 RepID=A0A951QLV8_9CYAN|nr:hypothetical protein [Cyanomargarita calcarea GSE-NOS-MK-12-04C]
MTPRELQTKWAISRTLLPAILGKGYRRIDDYLAGSCEIPDSVRSQCWLIDFYLSHGGSVPDFIKLQIRNYCAD